jgi:hypothetical protein
LLVCFGAVAAEQEEDEDAIDRLECQFEEMLDRVRMVRQQGANLSDAERRKLATDAALQLWALMGGGDEGPDSPLHSEEELD